VAEAALTPALEDSVRWAMVDFIFDAMGILPASRAVPQVLVADGLTYDIESAEVIELEDGETMRCNLRLAPRP